MSVCWRVFFFTIIWQNQFIFSLESRICFCLNFLGSTSCREEYLGFEWRFQKLGRKVSSLAAHKCLSISILNIFGFFSSFKSSKYFRDLYLFQIYLDFFKPSFGETLMTNPCDFQTNKYYSPITRSKRIVKFIRWRPTLISNYLQFI